MRNLAYKRVSTVDQKTLRQLDGVNVDFHKVFEDKCSGATTNRPMLTELLIEVERGDTVYVHSFDRLARNMTDLNALIERLNGKGVTVEICNPRLTFVGGEDNAYNKLMLNILGAVSEFEREMILERQREGVAKAKARGVYKGAKRKADRTRVRNLVADGVPKSAIAKQLGVSRQTVYDIMKAAS